MTATQLCQLFFRHWSNTRAMWRAGGNNRCRFTVCIVLYYTCLLVLFFHPVAGQTTTSSSTTPLTGQYCRTVFRDVVFNCPLDNYDRFTCMTCYSYLPEHFFVPGMHEEYSIRMNLQCDYRMVDRNNTYYPPEDIHFKNETIAIYQTVTEKGKQFWQECCEAAKKCCARMLNTPTKAKPGGPKYCPKTFDSWQCFDETEAGKIHESICEHHTYIVGDPPQCPQTLTRKCGDDGKWPGYNNVPNTERTDYTPCSGVEPLRKRHQAHVAAFLVSVCALVPALVILFSYRELRVPRITMHKNLFLSLLFNGIVYVVFKYLIVMRELDLGGEGTESGKISGVACRFLFALTKYTRATNYMWMFCEGFYLHKVIVAAFSEQKNLLIYYIFGWGLPIIPVLIYSILRITDPAADTKCWAQHVVAKYEWVVNGPNLVSLILNLLFLVNIIRVLVTKLRAIQTNDPHKQYRKAVRATLVLVPLFGLHFFVTAYIPLNTTCFWLEFYYYVLFIMDGLQGFLVALIFCYLNGEVIFLLRRSFRRWRARRRPEEERERRFTATTMSFVGTTTSEHSPSSNRSSQTMELKTKPLTNGS